MCYRQPVPPDLMDAPIFVAAVRGDDCNRARNHRGRHARETYLTRQKVFACDGCSESVRAVIVVRQIVDFRAESDRHGCPVSSAV